MFAGGGPVATSLLGGGGLVLPTMIATSTFKVNDDRLLSAEKSGKSVDEMDSLDWLNGSGGVSMSFALRVAVMVLLKLRHSLAYKVIRAGC